MRCDPKSRESWPRGAWTLIYLTRRKAKKKKKKTMVKQEPLRGPPGTWRLIIISFISMRLATMWVLLLSYGLFHTSMHK